MVQCRRYKEFKRYSLCNGQVIVQDVLGLLHYGKNQKKIFWSILESRLFNLMLHLLNLKNSETVKQINSENTLNCDISLHTFPVKLFKFPFRRKDKTRVYMQNVMCKLIVFLDYIFFVIARCRNQDNNLINCTALGCTLTVGLGRFAFGPNSFPIHGCRFRLYRDFYLSRLQKYCDSIVLQSSFPSLTKTKVE